MSCWVPRLFFHWLGDLPSKRWISMTLGCWLLAKPQLQMVNYPLNKWQQFWATGWSSLLISLAFIGVNNAEITAGLRKRVGDIYYISSACLICSSDYFLEPCWNSDLVNYLFLIYSFLSQQQIANYRIKVLIKILSLCAWKPRTNLHDFHGLQTSLLCATFTLSSYYLKCLVAIPHLNLTLTFCCFHSHDLFSPLVQFEGYHICLAPSCASTREPE